MLQHIRDQLPELRSRINELIIATQSELTSLGDLGLPGKAHRGTLLVKLVTNYVTDFHAAIEGTLRVDSTTCDDLYISCCFSPTEYLLVWLLSVGLVEQELIKYSTRSMPMQLTKWKHALDCHW